MPSEGVVARKCLLFATHGTSDLLLTAIVDSVFVTRKIVGPGEDGVARLVGGRIDACALMWTSLRVTSEESCGRQSTTRRSR